MSFSSVNTSHEDVKAPFDRYPFISKFRKKMFKHSPKCPVLPLPNADSLESSALDTSESTSDHSQKPSLLNKRYGQSSLSVDVLDFMTSDLYVYEKGDNTTSEKSSNSNTTEPKDENFVVRSDSDSDGNEHITSDINPEMLRHAHLKRSSFTVIAGMVNATSSQIEEEYGENMHSRRWKDVLKLKKRMIAEDLSKHTKTKLRQSIEDIIVDWREEEIEEHRDAWQLAHQQNKDDEFDWSSIDLSGSSLESLFSRDSARPSWYYTEMQRRKRRDLRRSLMGVDYSTSSSSTDDDIFELLIDFKQEEEQGEPSYTYLPKSWMIRRDAVGLNTGRGFRNDHANLNKRVGFLAHTYYLPSEPEEPVIFFTEQQDLYSFLKSIGFIESEAMKALRVEHLGPLLKVAVKESRLWTRFLTLSQGTLLFLLAHLIDPTVVRYFKLLVEAIVNNRITNALELDMFHRTLVKAEKENLCLLRVVPKIQETDIINTVSGKKEIVARFIDIYNIANNESMEVRGKEISEEELLMVEYVCFNFRPALENHLPLIAKYIGQGLLKTKMDLIAALTFAAREEKVAINLLEMENFIGLTLPKEVARDQKYKDVISPHDKVAHIPWKLNTAE